jgi:hypothetical protein
MRNGTATNRSNISRKRPPNWDFKSSKPELWGRRSFWRGQQAIDCQNTKKACLDSLYQAMTGFYAGAIGK